jgi:uncharacterized membrane protein
VWSWLTFGLFIVSLVLIARHSGYRFGWWSVLPLTCGYLLSNALWDQFVQGQLNSVILFCMTLGWINTRNERPWRAGIWLGLAAAIKLFPGFLGLYFLFRREWKQLTAMVLSFSLMTLLTIATLGVDTYADYIRTCFLRQSNGAVPPRMRR